jgi:cytochrome b561/polyisoprenoid-binding protein YceI
MTERPQSPARYHSAAIVLHWLLAGFLVYQFALGLRLDELKGGDKFVAFQLHKSIGITVLLLSLARVALRLFVARPAEFGQGAQKLAARLVHWGFYAVMLLGPLTGWIIVSTSKIKVPTMLFGVVPWPHLPLPEAFNEPADLAHTVLVWALPALIVLHVAGVLYHWRLRDEVPGRMLSPSQSIGFGLLGGLMYLLTMSWWGAVGPVPNYWRTPMAAPAPVQSNSLPLPAPPASDSADASHLTPVPTDTASGAETALSCNWSVEPGSRLGFATGYGNTPINGTFHKWQAKIRFCEDDLAHASIAATVNLASADTSDADRDENLKGASFFEAARFAQARFTASGFKPMGPGRYAANGTLSLHGVSRQVRLVFTLKVNGDAASAQGSTSLSRLAFGVGGDEWAATDQIPDAVTVQFTIRATRAN